MTAPKATLVGSAVVGGNRSDTENREDATRGKTNSVGSLLRVDFGEISHFAELVFRRRFAYICGSAPNLGAFKVMSPKSA